MDVAGVCQEFMNGQSVSEAPKLIAKGIQAGQTDLLKFVEALGIYLTSSDVDNRSQGTRLLSHVLANLSTHTLLLDEVQYLVEFFCDRLKDRVVITPHVLYGLHALVSHHPISDESVVKISRALFKEVHNQALQFAERRWVYSMLSLFLSSRHLPAVRAGLASEFVLGFIQTMDGERDPRNLLAVFATVPVLVEHLPYEVLAEDLFEVVSCYFPIDFTPPPNDPEAVSPAELIEGLRKCLTCSPKFAEFCLPLLLEKLSSDLLTAKLDSLHTLCAGAEVFGAEGLKTFIEPLWNLLKREVFQSASLQVESASLAAITAITSAVSCPLQTSGSGPSELDDLVALALQDCLRHLHEPELRLMAPAGRVLQAVGGASDAACCKVIVAVVPTLLEQYPLQTKSVHKGAVLATLLEFVKLAHHFSSSEEVSSPLLPYKAALSALLMSILDKESHAPLRVVAIATLSQLLEVPGLLEAEELCVCSERLRALAVSDTDGSVCTTAALSLGSLARLHPLPVLSIVLPPLLTTLREFVSAASDHAPQDPDHTPSMETDHTPSPTLTVKLLSAISTHPSLLPLTLPPLLDLLQWLHHTSLCGTPTIPQPSITSYVMPLQSASGPQAGGGRSDRGNEMSRSSDSVPRSNGVTVDSPSPNSGSRVSNTTPMSSGSNLKSNESDSLSAELKSRGGGSCDQSGDQSGDPMLELALVTCSSLLSVVERGVEVGGCGGLFKDVLVPRLLEMCVSAGVSGDGVSSDDGVTGDGVSGDGVTGDGVRGDGVTGDGVRGVLCDGRVLEVLADVLRCYSLALDVSGQRELLQGLVAMLVSGEGGTQRLTCTNPSAPASQTQLVCLLTAVTSTAHPQVLEGVALSAPLLELACRCGHTPSALQAAQCYACVVNKLPAGDALSQTLPGDLERVWSQLREEGSGDAPRLRALTVWLWLTKALLMRSHPLGAEAATKLLSLFAGGEGVGQGVGLAAAAAEGFALLLSDQPQLLSTQLHATVRLMYKQQSFVRLVPELLRAFHQSDTADRKHHVLRALSHMMQAVPRPVLLAELPTLLPVLLESLSRSEEGEGEEGGVAAAAVRVSTLEALVGLVGEAPLVISPHVPSLLPRLLQLAQTTGAMAVRIAALRCLKTLTTLPLHQVIPYKGHVIRRLAPCLDNHKRLVRKEAVSTRNKWYLLGEDL